MAVQLVLAPLVLTRHTPERTEKQAAPTGRAAIYHKVLGMLMAARWQGSHTLWQGRHSLHGSQVVGLAGPAGEWPQAAERRVMGRRQRLTTPERVHAQLHPPCATHQSLGRKGLLMAAGATKHSHT